MLETRIATPADAALITHHRQRMFADAGNQDNQVLDRMSANFQPWVEKMIAEGKYFGWFSVDGDRVAAGVGLLLLDWPPHPLDPNSTQRGYLLNVYVEPEYRRRKLASHLIEFAMAEARRRKLRVVSLHATDEGRLVYQRMGFSNTNEMLYVEPAKA